MPRIQEIKNQVGIKNSSLCWQPPDVGKQLARLLAEKWIFTVDDAISLMKAQRTGENAEWAKVLELLGQLDPSVPEHCRVPCDGDV